MHQFIASLGRVHSTTETHLPSHNTLEQGKVITLDVERDDMIEDVRQMIQEKEGISPDQQRLFQRVYRGWGGELENGHTLSDYHISSGTTLRLVGKSMLIFIRELSMTGESVPLGVDPTDTIESVKWMYHAQEGILPDTQQLFFGRNELENERLLSHYDIVNEAFIELLLPLPSVPRTGQIRVLVKTLTGKTIPLAVRLTDTVMSVKQKIQDIEGIPPDHQLLIVFGVHMDEERLLWTYGLEKDVTIHLILKLRGD